MGKTVEVKELDIFNIELDDSGDIADGADTANDKILADVNAACIIRAGCTCGITEAWIDRCNHRNQIIGVNRPQEVDQDYVDAFKFIAVITSEHGRYKDIKMLIKECKQCHKVEMYGDSILLAQLTTELIVEHAEHVESGSDEVESPHADCQDYLCPDCSAKNCPDRVV